MAVLLTSSTLAATPDRGSQIVVTGRVLGPEEAKDKAQRYVASIGMVTTVKPVARWLDRICPKVVGLGDSDIAARVESGICANASEVGARIAQPGCEGNLLLVFTADAEDLARRLNRSNPRLMAETTPTGRGRLISGKSAIRWWYSTDVRSADGQAAASAPPPWIAIDGGGPMSNDVGGDSGGGYTTSYKSSLVSTNVKRALKGVTILVDVSLAEGKNLDSVIDYATLVGLAEIRFGDDPPADSVLSLFAPIDPTERLTIQDLALLKSLYKLPLDRKGTYHRGWLVKDVSEALTTDN